MTITVITNDTYTDLYIRMSHISIRLTRWVGKRERRVEKLNLSRKRAEKLQVITLKKLHVMTIIIMTNDTYTDLYADRIPTFSLPVGSRNVSGW